MWTLFEGLLWTVVGVGLVLGTVLWWWWRPSPPDTIDRFKHWRP